MEQFQECPTGRMREADFRRIICCVIDSNQVWTHFIFRIKCSLFRKKDHFSWVINSGLRSVHHSSLLRFLLWSNGQSYHFPGDNDMFHRENIIDMDSHIWLLLTGRIILKQQIILPFLYSFQSSQIIRNALAKENSVHQAWWRDKYAFVIKALFVGHRWSSHFPLWGNTRSAGRMDGSTDHRTGRWQLPVSGIIFPGLERPKGAKSGRSLIFLICRNSQRSSLPSSLWETLTSEWREIPRRKQRDRGQWPYSR